MSAQQTLTEMGFPSSKIEQAIKVCGDNAEQAMEWLLAHADEPCHPTTVESGNGNPDADKNTGDKGDEPLCSSGNDASEVEMNDSSETNKTAAEDDSPVIAKSLKCDECQKLFKTHEEVEFHAHKSGHSSFSESTEEKKPLTEEGKRQKLKELDDKLKLRRKQKEEDEKKEVIEREKKRIQMSKDITETKRQMEEKEIKLIAEQRRKEKLEDKLARQKVKEQIERDKVARKEMFGGLTANAGTASSHCPPVTTSSVTQQPNQKKEYESTRLQIRLPSGPPLVQEFKVKESLSAVRLWIELNRKDKTDNIDSFTLSTTFPRRTFSDEDMDKPLNILELVPSAVLVVNDH